jgi:hypothetical protein
MGSWDSATLYQDGRISSGKGSRSDFDGVGGILEGV